MMNPAMRLCTRALSQLQSTKTKVFPLATVGVKRRERISDAVQIIVWREGIRARITLFERLGTALAGMGTMREGFHRRKGWRLIRPPKKQTPAT